MIPYYTELNPVIGY